MKILSKYVFREHAGPFTFALTALTSLMLLNFISRQFGELVGKGLGWDVIAEFFLLSIPFTVALTVPMSVLVATLYAFSRLAAENEVTALKATGVSPWRLVFPAIMGGLVSSLALLAFNDQVLPQANHSLKALQDDISQAKPTFLLKEQVINPISEGKFYLKAGKIDRSLGRMREVVIYDMGDPSRRRTIYADSGRIALVRNKDLDLDLYHGQMQEVSSDKPSQLNRLFYDHDRIRIKNVAGDFKRTDADSSSKGDREMSVCEMQDRLTYSQAGYEQALAEYENAQKPDTARKSFGAASAAVRPKPARGIGWVYCTIVRDVFKVKEAHAEEAPQGKRPRPTIAHTQAEMPATVTPAPVVGQQGPPPVAVMEPARAAEAKMRLDLATRSRNRYAIEIHKKFSLAAACLIFVILGAPLALRFPRGGVGLVLVVSLAVFALYYVGLIGGEALANDGIVPPFWAMWGTNVILTGVGLFLLFRMGKEENTGRGGAWSDRFDRLMAKVGMGRKAGA